MKKLPFEKKKKKVSLSKLKKKAWSEFSRYIRLKYANPDGLVECVTCGVVKHWKEMQAGHFIAGRTNSILFLEENVHCQDYRCNVMLHGNVVEYYKYMQATYGESVIDDLRKKRHENLKFTVEELEEMRILYRDKADRLIVDLKFN